jgi:hypothetical protein
MIANEVSSAIKKLEKKCEEKFEKIENLLIAALMKNPIPVRLPKDPIAEQIRVRNSAPITSVNLKRGSKNEKEKRKMSRSEQIDCRIHAVRRKTTQVPPKTKFEGVCHGCGKSGHPLSRCAVFSSEQKQAMYKQRRFAARLSSDVVDPEPKAVALHVSAQTPLSDSPILHDSTVLSQPSQQTTVVSVIDCSGVSAARIPRSCVDDSPLSCMKKEQFWIPGHLTISRVVWTISVTSFH